MKFVFSSFCGLCGVVGLVLGFSRNGYFSLVRSLGVCLVFLVIFGKLSFDSGKDDCRLRVCWLRWFDFFFVKLS